MLVLSRKKGEAIEFPSLGIVVRVVGLKHSKAVLGVEAPRDVTITRSEIATPRNNEITSPGVKSCNTQPVEHPASLDAKPTGSHPRGMPGFVTVRTEVFELLRRRHREQSESAKCVRENKSAYEVVRENPPCAAGCGLAVC